MIDMLHFGGTVDLPAQKTLHGPSFNLKSYRGKKIVVVAFWLGSCDLCIRQLETLRDQLKKENRAKDTAVMSVVRASGYERDSVDSILKDHKIGFSTVLDPDIKLARTFGVNMTPTFILLDINGRIATEHFNYVDRPIRDLTLINMIDLLRKGKDIPRLQFSPYTSDKTLRKMIGTHAPLFDLDAVGGEKYSLKSYAGRMNVVVAFWHPYSPDGKGLLNLLNSFYTLENRKRYNFTILAPASLFGANQMDQCLDFQKSLQQEFPLLNDATGNVGKMYNVKGIPTVFIIGEDGKIKDVVTSEFSSIDVKNRIIAAFE